MAMRTVLYGPEGIMLKHMMLLYNKEDLVSYAKVLEIRRISGLKKDELAEKIANELLLPSVMRRRIAVFSPECKKLFEKAINSPIQVGESDFDNACWLREQDYAFLNRQGILDVPVDVKAAYQKINTPEFAEYSKKMSWLAQCLYWGENFYGAFDKEILLKLYHTRKGYRISAEELEQICNEFPEDMTECYLERGSSPIVVSSLAYTGAVKDLLEIQEGKDFYIPSSDEILDFSKNLYLSKEPAYVKLRSFFQKQLHLTYSEADDVTVQLWEGFSVGEDFQDLFQMILDEYGENISEKSLQELVYLLQEANNHTRLMIHRGHTPKEIMKQEMRAGRFGGMPTIVPGSTNAANMLREASEELQKMSVTVDFEANAVNVPGTTNKKVYPNDPCPCGSGKKFKKCCGKR